MLDRRSLLKMALVATAFSWKSVFAVEPIVVDEDDDEDSSSFSVASSCSCTGRCLGGLADCSGKWRPLTTQADVDEYYATIKRVTRQ